MRTERSDHGLVFERDASNYPTYSMLLKRATEEPFVLLVKWIGADCGAIAALVVTPSDRPAVVSCHVVSPYQCRTNSGAGQTGLSTQTQPVACVLVSLGERDRAREWLAHSLAIDPEGMLSKYNSACIHAMLGESDEAVVLLEEWLKQADRHATGMPFPPFPGREWQIFSLQHLAPMH